MQVSILEALRNILFAPLELFFEAVFTVAFDYTQSEGMAIIILSLVVSTLVLPLYRRAEKIEAEQKAKENELSRWVTHIKKSFKGDEKYMMLDAYYRENHYNPILQLKSTFSILLQIPFFIAAYDLLGTRAADRFLGTGFFCFSNLGKPDGLFRIGNASINAMPILMTLISLLTTYIYTRGLPARKAIKSYLLPVLFFLVLYNSPTSLLLYWTMNNVYSLFKTIVIKRIIGKSDKQLDRKHPQKGIIDRFIEQKPNTALFILPATFLSVLTGLLIPLAYLSASPEEFINVINPQNPLRYIITSFFISVGFFIVWPGVFYYLANKNAKNVFSILLIGISVISAVDYLFFGTNTGTINTALVFSQRPEYSFAQKCLNSLLIMIIIIACILMYRFKKVLKITFVACILTTLTVSVLDAKIITDTYNPIIEHIEDYREKEAPQIRLSSSGKNVMVFMLDRAVSGYIPYIFYEFPELEEQFDGFVYYPNSLSFSQNTLKTSSALFGGYDYTPEMIDVRADETLAEKHDESLKVLPKIFSDLGSGVTVMDLPFPGWSWNGDYSSFAEISNCYSFHAKDYFTSDTEYHINTENRRNRNLFMYSLFRCAPLCLQGLIYDDGDYLSILEDYFEIYDVLENYKVLENLDDMTRVVEDESGWLFLMDNMTTHDVENITDFNPYSPYSFEKGYYISNGNNELYLSNQYQTSTYECTVAAFKAIGDYMDFLKEAGVYDNTRIIIVSDHGTWLHLFDDLIFEDVNAEWYNCLFMVKDFNSSGFKTDNTFMTVADVPSVALEGIVNNPINPYTGNPIDAAMKDGNLYVSYSDAPDEKLWNPDLNQGNTFYYDKDCIWFSVINGNIFDEKNWIKVDKPS